MVATFVCLEQFLLKRQKVSGIKLFYPYPSAFTSGFEQAIFYQIYISVALMGIIIRKLFLLAVRFVFCRR